MVFVEQAHVVSMTPASLLNTMCRESTDAKGKQMVDRNPNWYSQLGQPNAAGWVRKLTVAGTANSTKRHCISRADLYKIGKDA